MRLSDLEGATARGDRILLRAFGCTQLASELEAYNRWMADSELRYETGTDEIMTPESILEMQKQWLDAPDKFNYIIWSQKKPNDHPVADDDHPVADDDHSAADDDHPVADDDHPAADAPIGDIGLFYKTVDDHAVDYTEGEISMMIAERPFRRSGFGKLAHDLVIEKVKKQLNTTKIIAKIKDNNYPSIRFFEKLGYKEVSRSKVFEEITFELDLSGEGGGQ